MTRRTAVSTFAVAVFVIVVACDERMSFDTHYVAGGSGLGPDDGAQGGATDEGGAAGAEALARPRRARSDDERLRLMSPDRVRITEPSENPR